MNTSLIGASYYHFFLTDPTPDNFSLKMIVCLGGIFISIIWWFFNRAGRRLNHVYVEDAKSIAQSDNEIHKYYSNSLSDKTPSEAVLKPRKIIAFNVKKYLAPTWLNYYVIYGFNIAWIILMVFKPTKDGVVIENFMRKLFVIC
ncbi:hypothetical protein KFE98_02565 [bacterium SCSIO 12741]|nr:hypothetical protein KFE98_02565 [bacterium SCSIO 12741]